MAAAGDRLNAFTVDVEDYYAIFTRDRLPDKNARCTDAVVRNTEAMLALMASGGAKGTFFVLGEVAEAFPQVVRRIAAGGHELGVHGGMHRQFFKLTPDQARAEVGDARKRIEDLAGSPVLGHRAPAFSIRPDTAWALEVLADLGFAYDSSIHPAAGRRYGWKGFPLDIHEMKLDSGRRMIEAPMSVVSVMGKLLPACGGGYMRHFPYLYTAWALRHITKRRAAILYVHPYDIDAAAAPEAFAAEVAKAGPQVQRFHALQLRRRETMPRKLAKAMRSVRWGTLAEVIAQRGLIMPELRRSKT